MLVLKVIDDLKINGSKKKDELNRKKRNKNHFQWLLTSEWKVKYFGLVIFFESFVYKIKSTCS